MFVEGPTLMETTSSAYYISNGLHALTITVGVSQRLQMKTSHILTSIHHTKHINTFKLLIRTLPYSHLSGHISIPNMAT